MYGFVDVNEQQTTGLVLPSVALKFNGKYLENEITGYRTLTVSGRETLSNILEIHQVKNGSITSGKKLPSREIVVKYSVEAEDNQSFQKKFKSLRKALQTVGEVEFNFADESDAFYFGQLSEMWEISPESNTVVGTFSLLCDSPYIYGNRTETTGAIPIETFYETQPDLIKLTLTSAVSLIKITNTKQTIQLNGNFSLGDLIVIDVQSGTVTKNGVDHVYAVALNSDFENFNIEKGKTVTCSQGALQVLMRERWL